MHHLVTCCFSDGGGSAADKQLQNDSWPSSAAAQASRNGRGCKKLSYRRPCGGMEPAQEDLCLGLVREYLFRKGFVEVLRLFDEETNAATTINSATATLVRRLHMVNLYKRNQAIGAKPSVIPLGRRDRCGSPSQVPPQPVNRLSVAAQKSLLSRF